ncbi:hypothetical protein MXB_5251, partial [Myxobolus squamalis]
MEDVGVKKLTKNLLDFEAEHGKYDESKISPIGFFNFVGKERRSLWQQIQTLSSSDAQKNFCQLLKKHFLEYDSFITSFVGTVYWSIVTDHYDIGFRVFFDVNFEDSQEKSKKLSVEIIKSQRCNTHQLVHLGQHHYSSNGAYNFILDNSYSYLRAKTVYLN